MQPPDEPPNTPRTIEVRGHNGQVHFDGEWVTITRKGFLGQATIGKGEKRIHGSTIAAVQRKPADLVNGFIQFTVPGGVEKRSAFGRQATNAGRELGGVHPPADESVADLRARIEETIASSRLPQRATSAPPAAPVDVAGRMNSA